jgi:hypothetical protein
MEKISNYQLFALFSCIEIIVRQGEMFCPILILLFIIEVILIFSSDIINVQYIKPYLGKGWGNILKNDNDTLEERLKSRFCYKIVTL